MDRGDDVARAVTGMPTPAAYDGHRTLARVVALAKPPEFPGAVTAESGDVPS